MTARILLCGTWQKLDFYGSFFKAFHFEKESLTMCGIVQRNYWN